MDLSRLMTMMLSLLATASAAQEMPSPTSPTPNLPPTPTSDQTPWATLTILPTKDNTELRLAAGDTAILECRLSDWRTPSSVSLPSSVYAYVSLSWRNKETDVTMTTNSTSEYADSKASVTLKVDEEQRRLSLLLTLHNLSGDAGETPFECKAEAQGETQPLVQTISVAVVSSEWMCTFEGETNCRWDHGGIWTRKESAQSASGLKECGDPIDDHTYGKSMSTGHYVAADVTGYRRSSVDDSILNTTVVRHEASKCLRLFYRFCSAQSMPGESLLIKVQRDQVNSSFWDTVDVQPKTDWVVYSLHLPAYANDYQIIISAENINGSFVAIDDITIENGVCSSSDDSQPDIKASPIGDTKLSPTPTTPQSTTLPSTSGSSSPPSSSTTPSPSASSSTTTTAPPSTTTTKPSTASAASTAGSSTTSTSATVRSSLTPMAGTTETTVTSSSVKASSSPPSSSSSLPSPTTITAVPTPVSASSQSDSSLSVSATVKASNPDEGDESTRSTNQDGASEPDDEGGSDSGGTASEAGGDNSTGLAIGIILAIMVAGACTAAILYRRRKNGKKSTYITFGNPSYSREHLPVNDFGLDSPLTLSSNGYTVLA